MEKFTPTIISSKRAKRKVEEIKAKHADIMRRMDEHKVNVASYKQQKEAERVAKEQMMQEHLKMVKEQQAKETADNMAREKDRMAHEVKLKELELKKQALSNG